MTGNDRRPIELGPATLAITLVAASAALCHAADAGGFHAPPGHYTTSWVGNTFGGNGGPNGLGYWVQDAADEIEVTPDGTVLAGTPWDEAGRCAGLYKDGRTNRVLLRQEHAAKETAWGWNTGNCAVAVDGEWIFIANTGKRLLRFRWKPGEIDSARYDRQADLADNPVGLTAGGGNLAVVYGDRIEIRSQKDLTSETGGFALAGAADAAFAPDGTVWVIARGQVLHLTTAGKRLGKPLAGIGKPSAVAVDPRGRLIVCDNGPDQQVRFFDVSGQPTPTGTFGRRGGLRAGVPGLVEPTKLFALRGAGADANGNLYVAMSFASSPTGNLYLRSFTPQGKLRWEVMSTAFVDTFGFDPASDGKVVYGRTAVFDLDLSRTQPGSEWRLKAVTIDPVRDPNDPRIKAGGTALLRHVGGRRLLYVIGQYAGGYQFFAFDDPNSWLARPVGEIGGKDRWAWDVDDKGDIWAGDGPGRKILRYRFGGWSADGKPRYTRDKPDAWPWPNDFQRVTRIHYDAAHDVLYLTGYLNGQRVETWGLVGPTARRYDGWVAGGRRLHWTNAALPRDRNGNAKEGPLTPKAMAVAGDYIFLGMVKPTDGKQLVHILRADSGTYVGTFQPGPATGEGHGWLDMPYAVAALRRRNGEYLLLVEEDWRGKNLLYRWRPAVAATGSNAGPAGKVAR